MSYLNEIGARGRALLGAASVLLSVLGMAPVANAQPADGRKLPQAPVSEDNVVPGRFVTVNGQPMHYLEAGEGDPILFVHGNPTSSYLWRNVLPEVADQGRAIAVDLIGMGKSAKPDIDYRYADHYAYFEAFIETLALRDITFVLHDWGATLGFDFARRHPERVKGIAFMEGVLPPTFPQPSFEAMGAEMGGMFKAFKTSGEGERLVIEQNMFVEEVLPNFVSRTLGPRAMAEYRAPFADPQHRKPLLAWPRAIPIAGEPADVVQVMGAIDTFMQTTQMPTLLIYADPGVVVPRPVVAWYEQHLRNLSTAYVGQGLHFIQEDSPVPVGLAVRDWARRNKNPPHDHELPL